MSSVTVQQFAVVLTCPFPAPVIYANAGVPQVASRLLERLSSYNPRSSDFTFREGNKFFDYDLCLRLFNGSARLEVTSEGVKASFFNAQSNNDVGIIAETITGFFESLGDIKVSSFQLSVYVHVAFPSDEEGQTFLKGLGSVQANLPIHGTVLRFEGDEYIPDSKVIIEQSNFGANVAFFDWSVKFPSLAEVLDRSLSDFRAILHRCGLDTSSSSEV